MTSHTPAMVCLGLAVLSGCAHHGAGPSEQAEVQYAIDIDADFSTSVEGEGLSTLASLGDTSLTLHLVVSLAPSREFRDGSQGALVRFVRAWAVSTIGEAPPTRLDPGGLQGRSVELRTFPGKEILTIDMVDHVAGGDRQADVFDLLWPILAPFPPPLDEGETGVRTVGWPFRLSKSRGIRDSLNMHWENRGLGDLAGTAAWELSYEGPWSVRGADRATVPPTLVTGEGRASGRTWYRASDSELVAHEFDWVRLVSRRPVGPDAPSWVVEQRQHFVGRLERLP